MADHDDEPTKWLRPGARRTLSSATSAAASQRAPSRTPSSHEPRSYKRLLSLLLSTIPNNSKKWKLLDAEWWNALADEYKDEVLEWAQEVWNLANGKKRVNPELPHYLVTARDLATDSKVRKKARKFVEAMESINRKADVKYEEHYKPAHSLGKGSGHEYRAIGHRAARRYGTTKREWEAGRSWQ
ncbi:hypothetical protein JCM10449v2_005326 [Rhodotorula kratochvilovae]